VHEDEDALGAVARREAHAHGEGREDLLLRDVLDHRIRGTGVGRSQRRTLLARARQKRETEGQCPTAGEEKWTTMLHDAP
jgi:hypothetical protein